MSWLQFLRNLIRVDKTYEKYKSHLQRESYECHFAVRIRQAFSRCMWQLPSSVVSIRRWRVAVSALSLSLVANNNDDNRLLRCVAGRERRSQRYSYPCSSNHFPSLLGPLVLRTLSLSPKFPPFTRRSSGHGCRVLSAHSPTRIHRFPQVPPTLLYDLLIGTLTFRRSIQLSDHPDAPYRHCTLFLIAGWTKAVNITWTTFSWS